MVDKISILLVEDSFFMAMELAEHLEMCGFDVIGPTASLSRAEELFARHRPDIVLLDVNLGREGSSCDFALQIKRCGVPFVFLTGYEALVVNHAEFDEVPLLVKPVSLDRVVQQIEIMCA